MICDWLVLDGTQYSDSVSMRWQVDVWSMMDDAVDDFDASMR